MAVVEPSQCVEPFGAITFSARVDGNHLVTGATWTVPLAAGDPAIPRLTVLSSYLLCCDGVVTSQFSSHIVSFPTTAAEVSIGAASIAAECAGEATIAVRSFLHWRQGITRAVDPPSLRGAAVFDAVFDRGGTGLAVVGTTQWTGLAHVCFPPVN